MAKTLLQEQIEQERIKVNVALVVLQHHWKRYKKLEAISKT